MNEAFDSTRVRLRGTMNRMLRMAERTGVGWKVWIGFFLAVFLLFAYVWLFWVIVISKISPAFALIAFCFTLLLIGGNDLGRIVYSKHGYCMGWRYFVQGSLVYTGVKQMRYLVFFVQFRIQDFSDWPCSPSVLGPSTEQNIQGFILHLCNKANQTV